MNQESKSLSEEKQFFDSRTTHFICAIILIIEFFLPSLSPVIVFIMLYHAFKLLWALTSSEIPPGKVSIFSFEKENRRKLRIEIGGPLQNNNWLDYLRTSAQNLGRVSVVYKFRTFEIDVLVHVEPDSETVAIQNLSRTLEIISASANFPRAVNLDLNVQIVGTDPAAISNAIEKESLTLGGLEKLERLSWKGPFPRCLLQTRQPRQRVLKDLLFLNAPPLLVSNIKLPHLKDLRLTECVVEPSTVLDLISCSPTLASVEIDRIGYTPEQFVYNQHTQQLNPSSSFKHLHLKRLIISSAISLEYIFKHMQPQNLESLSLRLACSAIGTRVEEDIMNLEIPWSPLKKFELKAPMDFASMCSLNLFFKTEPSPQGSRDYILVEDWWMDSRRRLSFLHPRMSRSLVTPQTEN